MRDVGEKVSSYFVGDCPETCEIQLPRVGGSTANEKLGLALSGAPPYLVVVEQAVGVHSIPSRVVDNPREGGGGAMSEMAARLEGHTQNGIAGPQNTRHHDLVRATRRVWLDVGELRTEQGPGPGDCEVLHAVHLGAPGVVAHTRVPFGRDVHGD
jgi:hypothetical protein